MNRTKVTVACKACQKKKVKCTGISPCTNCIKAGHRCEFTGTAKKRGPRNGNVEIIKSPARRIENVLQENPNLRDQIQHLLAHNNNARPCTRSARPPPVIPSDAPIVIIDDDTGVTTDASQSHGIPRPSNQDRHGHAAVNLGAYPRDGFSINPQINNYKQPQPQPLRKPIPRYPVSMRNHVTSTAQCCQPESTSPHLDSISLPSISELGTYQDIKPKCLRPSQILSPNCITLPVPNCSTRKKSLSMPIVNLSGIKVLLPPAPDLINPFDSISTLSNQNKRPNLSSPPPLSPLNKKRDMQASPISAASPLLSLPSPPSSFESPKPTSPSLLGKFQSINNNPPTPTDSSPPSSPRNVFPGTNFPCQDDNNFVQNYYSRGDEMEIV